MRTRDSTDFVIAIDLRLSSTGIVASDYKTGLQSPPSELYERYIFQTELPVMLNYLIFDLNGPRLGSIYTSSEAYTEAIDLMEDNNIIYNCGNITIVKTR